MFSTLGLQASPVEMVQTPLTPQCSGPLLMPPADLSWNMFWDVNSRKWNIKTLRGKFMQTWFVRYSDIYISFNLPSDVILGMRLAPDDMPSCARIYDISPLLAATMILFRTHLDGGTLDASGFGQHRGHYMPLYSQKVRLFKCWVSALYG